jgi:hypothetical protein
MVATRYMLGLAIDDSGVVATELCVRSGRAEIRAAGELVWKQELTAETAKDLGDQLRQFLQEHGFSSSRAVVGLAAKWVLAKEIDVPPAGPDALAGILSIQAERAFSLDANEMIFDYCGNASLTEKGQVLLFAVPRQIVDRIKALTESAGLRVQSVTVSALACSGALSEADPDCGYGLYARPTYCEFWSQVGGTPQFIRHVPICRDGTPAGYADLLTSTIQRLVLLSAGQGQSPPHQITAYDACGLSAETVDEINGRLGPDIVVRDGHAGLRSRGLYSPDHPEASRSVAATAVAMTSLGGTKPLVDFLNPRIGRKKVSRRTRLMAWASFLAVACLIGLGVVVADWQRNKADIAAYTTQLEQMSDDITAAKEIVDRVSYAGSWTSHRRSVLDCLKGLTEAFPDEPSVWAKNLALNENGTGSLFGKATSEASFYAVLDKIKENRAFTDVKMVHVRDAGRNSSEKEFQITFTFKGAK